MPNWLVFAIVALAFSVVATWVVRRLLDVEVGWLRAWVTVDRRVRHRGARRDLVAEQVGRVRGRPVLAERLRLDRVRRAHGRVDARGRRDRGAVAASSCGRRGRWRNPITVCATRSAGATARAATCRSSTIGSRHGLTFYESRRHGEGEEDELPTALVSAHERGGGDVRQARPGAVLAGGRAAAVVHRGVLDAADGLVADPVAGSRGGDRRAAGPADRRGLRRDRSDAARRGIRRPGARRATPDRRGRGR